MDPYYRLLFAAVLFPTIVIFNVQVSAQTLAERTLPSEPYVPGIIYAVSIQVTGDPGPVTVTETLPPGWNVSQVLGGGQVNGGVITWDLPSFDGDHNLRYWVTPPNDATRDAVFSGQVGDREIGGMTALPAGRLPFSFGAPVNLGTAINTQYGESQPGISTDGLELYFTSDRPGGLGLYDLWVAIRTTTSEDWSEPVHLGPEINSPNWDYYPKVSADGLALYFASDRSGGNGAMDLWVTTRSTPSSPWGPPENFGSAVNTASDEFSPSLSGDGLSLFFTSNRENTNGWDIYTSTRARVDAEWAPAEPLAAPLNSPNDEGAVFLARDGLTLFLTSNRPNGLGDYDLYAAARDTVAAPWSAPVNLGSAVNTKYSEVFANLSGDGRMLYFSDWPNARPGGRGEFDLWQVPVERITPSALEDWNVYR